MSENQHVFNELKESGTFYRKDLISYVEWLAGTMSWTSGDSKVLSKGQTPEDVAHEVIRKALDGTRAYDPDRVPFRVWLRTQARSELSHLVRSASHRRETELLEDESISDTSSAGPETVIIEQEDEEIVSQSVAAIIEAVDGKLKLQEIVEAILNGCAPEPRHLAEELDVEVNDIYNRLKRLRRLLRKGQSKNE